MDRLNKVASYFNEKERRRLDKIIQESNSGLPEMSFDEIKLTCLENNGYETPELNDKLYLHFRGFKAIANLDRYTGCKALWLDSNGFTKIENLFPLIELRCLYLSKNLITKIEGLDALQHLTILDLSNNRISCIENLSSLDNLETLILSHNAISSMDAITHLQTCVKLNNVDLTNNRLEANDAFYSIIAAIPSLLTISVNGNELTKLPSFRKKLIVANPKLGYIDRPVDDQERFFAIAFVSGGAEAETNARAEWKQRQEESRIAQLREFKEWQVEQQRVREVARAEGRSLIREFTAEEQAIREAEAQAAADAEKRMLDIGIDRIGSRYWQLESSCVSAGKDPLDVALEQLTKERMTLSTVVATGSDKDHYYYDDDGEDRATGTNKYVSDINDIDVEIMTINASGDDDLIDSIVAVGVEECKVLEEEVSHSTTIVEDKDGVDDSDDVNAMAVLRLAEQKEEEIRQERVAESFHIYMRQLEAQKKSGGTSSSSLSCPRVNTWEGQSLPSSAIGGDDKEHEDDSSRPLYWSEAMDIHLAGLVKTCLFDFDEISIKMQELASKKELSYHIVHNNPHLISTEACRLRWSDLDASQWSEVAPNTSALDTQFKVCIPNSVLGAGHGAQPSFSALASMTAGTMPTYLKVPTRFPSVQDLIEDDMDLD